MRNVFPGTCIFCQCRCADTKDHVPPRLIFPDPRPDNLITVPACEQCNRSFSKDDEYFRIYLSARQAGEEHSGHKLLLEKSLRSLERSAKFEQYWNSRLRVFEKVRIDGTVDYVAQFQPDDTRLENFGERIVRGLFYHHHREPLQTDTSFNVWFDHGFDTMNQESQYSEVSDLLRESEVYQVGAVFSYQFEVANKDKTVTIWRLKFLDKIWCVVITNASPN